MNHLHLFSLKSFRRYILTYMVYICLFLLLNSFAAKRNVYLMRLENSPVILGFAHGFKDSTWLYIEDLKFPALIIDSTQIFNERFYFNSKKLLSNKAKQYVIRTKSYSDFKNFWIDSKPIVFSGVKGQFRNSLVSGSVSQHLFEDFEKLSKPFISEIDSLKRNYGTTDSLIWKRILDLEEKLKQSSAKFIKHNYQSIISAYLLSLYCRNWGLDLSTQLYNSLSTENQRSDYGFAVNRFITLNKKVEVGKQFEDFEQKSVDGKNIRLSSLKGKFILLEFWASWCGPCRKDNPNILKIYNDYKSRGFEVFGVSLDVSEVEWKNAIAKDKLTWVNVSDLKGGDNGAALIYGVYEIPSNFLIDPTGKIIAKNLRGEQLRIKLESLFRN